MASRPEWRFRVRRPKFLVGRGEECHLRPQSHLVSRMHCAILVEEGSATIEDCGSTNGTFVNGEKIQAAGIEQRRSDQDRHVGVRGPANRGAADKKKPKVHTVQEAAARKVASTASIGDEDEISRWLAEDGQRRVPRRRPSRPPSRPIGSRGNHDTIVGKPTDDTTTSMPADKSPPKKETKSRRRKRGPIQAACQAGGRKQRLGGRGHAEAILPRQEDVIAGETTVRAADRNPQIGRPAGLGI